MPPAARMMGPCAGYVRLQVRKTAIREAKILKQLQHPNVVRLLEVCRTVPSVRGVSQCVAPQHDVYLKVSAQLH